MFICISQLEKITTKF